jgi:hypothetical protein
MFNRVVLGFVAAVRVQDGAFKRVAGVLVKVVVDLAVCKIEYFDPFYRTKTI